MSNISNDISTKIDRPTREILLTLSSIARRTDDPLLVVGASARDLVFTLVHGIETGRATMDLDLAVRVRSWEAFERFASEMISLDLFARDLWKPHRFVFMQSYPVDVIPYGDLEQPPGSIRWPSNSSDMRTLGFGEAFDHAVILRIADDVEVRVTSPPGLTMMKLFSWDEAQPTRPNDARDIDFMLREYERAGNEQRIYGSDSDMSTTPDFDLRRVSPRLLGRDIAAMAEPETLNAVLKILENETDPHGYGRLVRDMMMREGDFDEEFRAKTELLVQLKLGILDGKHRTA